MPVGSSRAVAINLPDLGEEEISNFVEDDWDDNNLTNRTSPSDGVYVHPNVNEAGDVLIGRYRPEWSTVFYSGPNPGAQNQQLEHDFNGTSTYYTVQSNVTSGRWSVDFQFSTLGNDFDHQDLLIMYSGSNNYLRLDTNDSANGSGDSYVLQKRASGSNTNLFQTSWDNDQNQHSKAAERDSYGNFEGFYDGTSMGTATDQFIPPEPFYTGVGFRDSAGGSYVNADNLVIR